MTRQVSDAYTQLFSQDFTASDEMKSTVFYPIPSAQKSTFYIASDQDGTADIDIRLSDDEWYPVLEDVATTGTKLTTITVEMPAIAIRVRWTPMGTPGTLTIDGSYVAQGRTS